ncbi:protein DEFECTIVE IN MERISTEM SILENCING 3-like [Silene latifolia]|uniref:protein DEFECTIVE IN MERISTEM SILENCING 3-like n=1 Tax=Silene latifolia TaxID=37657 RepID=UPI003D778255
MYPMNSPIPLNSKALVVHDIEALNHVNPNSPNVNSGNGVPNGAPFANNLMTGTKRLQDELEKTGTKMRQHEDNLKFLKSQKNQLDDAILDLQVNLGKSLSSGAPSTEDGGSSLGRSEEETVEQISKHEKSAANIFCQLKICHGIQLSNPALSQELLGVVATLGKVEDDNLSRLFSEYLGLPKMLSVVCKTYDGIKALETYDFDGAVNKFTGLYALGSSVGHSLEGRFLVICLENLRPYAGEIIADDPQKRLDILHPRLPNGEIPAGFLGFAVNMVHIDRSHLYSLTSSGCGLRETLFYNLFSRLQVYRTRAEMLVALPFITDGAVSLDGGMISATGVFALGSREDVGVTFPRCSGKDRLPVKYYELENQLKQKKWEKDRLQEDIRREQALLDQQKYNYQLQKQEFLRFIADSSSFLTQHQLQTAGRVQTPR